MSLLLRNKDRIFYGWVIVVASLIIITSLFGTRSAFGVFFKPLQGEFELTRLITSSIFSASAAFSAVFVIISGWALDRYGPRLVVCLMGLFTGLSLIATAQTNSLWQIFLSYSLLLSIGTAGTITVLVATVSRWFGKKRGVAIGIASSGSGLGTLLVVPFAAYLVSNLDWRMSFTVLGLVAWLVVIPPAMLLRRPPGEMGTLSDGVRPDTSRTGLVGRKESSGQTGPSLRQAFRTRSFWLLLSIWLLYSSCLTLVITHIVPHTTDVGIPVMTASTILSAVGALQILSRLLVGRVSDLVGRRVPGIVCAMLMAGALIWLIPSQDLWMFYLFAVVYGLSWGGLSVATLTMISEIFEGRSLGMIMGAIDIGFAAGSAIGPALGGFIFDVTGSYAMAFAIGAAAMSIVALLLAFVKPERITRID